MKIHEIGLSLIAFTTLIIISYYIGHIITVIFKNKTGLTNTNKWYFIFQKYVLGLLIITVTTAVYFTHFKTIQILLLIPFIFTVKFNKTLKLKDFFGNITLNFKVIFFILISFIIQWFFHFGSTKQMFYIEDIRLYAEIGNGLINGNENSYGVLSYFDGSYFKGVTPYHYTEIWLSIFVNSIFDFTGGLNQALITVVYPAYILAIIFLLAAWAQYYNKVDKIIFWLPTLLFLGVLPSVFISNWFLNLPINTSVIIWENSSIFDHISLIGTNSQKSLPSTLILGTVILLLRLKQNKTAFLLLGVAPVVNAPLLPGILGGVLLWGIITLYKERNTKQVVTQILMLAIGIVSFGVFYKLLQVTDNQYPSFSYLYLGDPEINLKGEIMRAAIRVVSGTVYFLLLYMPLLLLLLFKPVRVAIKSLSNNWILIISIVSIPLLFRFILNGFDSGQFLTYLLGGLNLMIIFTLLSIPKLPRQSVVVLTAVTCMGIIYQIKLTTSLEKFAEEKYSNSFIETVIGKMPANKKTIIGYISSQQTLLKTPPKFWYNHNFPGEYLSIYGYNNFISLNYPYYNYSKSSINELSTRNSMLYFFRPGTDQATFKASLPEFVSNHGIKYICSADTTKPQWVKLLADTIIEDTQSKEWFAIMH